MERRLAPPPPVLMPWWDWFSLDEDILGTGVEVGIGSGVLDMLWFDTGLLDRVEFCSRYFLQINLRKLVQVLSIASGGIYPPIHVGYLLVGIDIRHGDSTYRNSIPRKSIEDIFVSPITIVRGVESVVRVSGHHDTAVI